MPRPTSSAVHVDRPLTNISVAHLQSQEDFAAMRTFPRVPVQFRSDLYYKFDRGDFNRDDAQLRAPGTESAGSGYGLNTGSYNAQVWAYHKDVSDQVLENADAALRPFEEATQFVTHKILIRMERDWASNFFSTGIWGGEEDGSGSDFTQWSDSGNSDPVIDIRRGKTNVKKKTGFMPNKLTISQDVFDTLIDHPDIIDRIKYGQTQGGPAVANRQTLAAVLGLDEIVVGSAIYNTANQGASDSHDFVLGKDALLTFSPQSPGLQTPSAGYTFAWRGFMNNVNDMGFAIKRFRIEEREAERVEGQGAWDHNVVSTDLGYFFANAIQ